MPVYCSVEWTGMSSGIAGIYICISIGPVTASPTAQHPLPAGQKTCDWLRDLHRARRFIIQDRADPGEKQTLEAKVELWQAGQPWSGSWFAAGAWKRPAARSCVALGWLISTSQHFSCPDKTIITSAVEQVFWLFRQHRGKYESTELLERFTGRVDSK